jgi:hypothetical protein
MSGGSARLRVRLWNCRSIRAVGSEPQPVYRHLALRNRQFKNCPRILLEDLLAVLGAQPLDVLEIDFTFRVLVLAFPKAPSAFFH